MKLVTVSNKIYLCSIALFVAVLQGDPNMPQDLFNIHQYRGHIKQMATVDYGKPKNLARLATVTVVYTLQYLPGVAPCSTPIKISVYRLSRTGVTLAQKTFCRMSRKITSLMDYQGWNR